MQDVNMKNMKNSPISDVIKTMPSSGMSWILYLVFSFLMLGLIFSYFSKIDITVKAPVKIVKYNNYGFKFQSVQSEFMGRVNKLYIKDGDKVNEGDTLLELISENVYDTLSESDSMDSKITSLNLSLRTEKNLKDKKIDELNNRFNNQKIVQSKENNKQITIIDELKHEKLRLNDAVINRIPNKFNNQIKLSEETIKYLKNKTYMVKKAFNKGFKTGEDLSDIENRLTIENINLEKINADFANEISNAKKDLLKIDDQIKRAEIEIDLIKVKNPNSELDRSIAIIDNEFEKQKLQINSEIKNLNLKLNQVKINPKFNSSKYVEIKKENNILKILIKSPIKGFVDSLKVLSTGEIIESGKVLMNIYPESADLIAEANVSSKDIGLLKEGMETKIKFDSFPYQDYGFLQGVVWKISKDSTSDQRDGGDIYKLRARFDNNYLRKNTPNKLFENINDNNDRVTVLNNKKIILKQGLTGTMEIIKEKKSILDLIIKPFKEMSD